MTRRPRKSHGRSGMPTVRVSVVIFDDQGRLLLVKHKKRTKHLWVLPGGRLEYGESFFECARREVKEETGLIVEPERIIFLSEAIAPDRSRHVVNVFVKAKVSGGVLKVGDEEILDACQYMEMEKLNGGLKIFPPVASELETFASGNSAWENIEKNKGIKYLGNLWM